MEAQPQNPRSPAERPTSESDVLSQVEEGFARFYPADNTPTPNSALPITAPAALPDLINQLLQIAVTHDQIKLPVSQLAAALNTALQTFEQQRQYQDVVNRLVTTIRNTSNLAEVLELATENTAQALQARHGMLLRIKYLDPLLRNVAIATLPEARVTVMNEWIAPTSHSTGDTPSITHPPTLLHKTFRLSECRLCQQAFKSSYPLAFTHPQWADDKASTWLPYTLNLDSSNSLLVAPLESQGTVLGFLVFHTNQFRSWQQADLELVNLVSAQVSNAIIQTETLRQVQSLVEKRTAELQQSLTIQAKLYERTRQQVEQLRHLNQLKDEFLDTVSHELRTPLTSMALAIRMLRQVPSDDDRSHRYLDILEQQCAQETRLVNDLLALRELESKQVVMQVEEINLVPLIQELTQPFQAQWAKAELNLELDLPSHAVKIESDRDSFSRILLELLTNAGKYSTSHQTVQLKLSCRQEAATDQPIILSLTNIGAGISADELPYIFDKFRRCPGSIQNAIQGTGLGLALVKNLVQHLNGTLSVSSSPLENSSDWETCFSLSLPCSINLAKQCIFS